MRITIGLLVIIFISCQSNENKLNRFLNQQLIEQYSSYLSQYDSIVIIPRKGCNACIENAEEFLKKEANNKQYLFIFTRVQSGKHLKLVIGESILSLKNILIDNHDLFYHVDYEDSAYPLLLIKQKNGSYSYKRLDSL